MDGELGEHEDIEDEAGQGTDRQVSYLYGYSKRPGPFGLPEAEADQSPIGDHKGDKDGEVGHAGYEAYISQGEKGN